MKKVFVTQQLLSALLCLEVSNYVSNFVIHRIVIEFDCQTLVNELQGQEPSTFFGENIIQNL